MSADLIERLEAASGPALILDAEIFWTLERERATAAFWRGAMGLPSALPDEFARLPRGLGIVSLEVSSPNYTASVDAALALAERVLPGSGLAAGRSPSGASWARVFKVRETYTEAATPALALCAAILQANEAGR